MPINVNIIYVALSNGSVQYYTVLNGTDDGIVITVFMFITIPVQCCWWNKIKISYISTSIRYALKGTVARDF